MTVIDASALVAFVLREEQWESIEGVLHEGPTSVDLLPAEAADAVLTARQGKRLDDRDAMEALRAIQDLSEVTVTLAPNVPLLAGAWEIAREEEVTIYDAIYIALARRERAALASRDLAQLRAARSAGVRTVEV